MTVYTSFCKALREEDGATAIEYGLIAALISVAFIIALTALGTSIDELFIYVAGILGNVVSGLGS